jgi:hypothetical protein
LTTDFYVMFSTTDFVVRFPNKPWTVSLWSQIISLLLKESKEVFMENISLQGNFEASESTQKLNKVSMDI